MYKAYKCKVCGKINVFKDYKIDGIECIECKGSLFPMGDCIVERNNDCEIKIGCDTSAIDKALKKVNLLNNGLFNAEVKLKKLNIAVKDENGEYRNIKDILDDLTMVITKHNVTEEHLETIAEFIDISNMNVIQLKKLLAGIYPPVADKWNIDSKEAYKNLNEFIKYWHK